MNIFRVKIETWREEKIGGLRFKAVVEGFAPHQNFNKIICAISLEEIAEILLKRWDICWSPEFEATIKEGLIVSGENRVSDQDFARYLAA